MNVVESEVKVVMFNQHWITRKGRRSIQRYDEDGHGSRWQRTTLLADFRFQISGWAVHQTSVVGSPHLPYVPNSTNLCGPWKGKVNICPFHGKGPRLGEAP